MAEMHRISKVKKFITKKVSFLERQQQVIEDAKKNGLPLEVISILEINQNVTYNYTFDLCKEFGLEMPHVLGVTPKTGGY